MKYCQRLRALAARGIPCTNLHRGHAHRDLQRTYDRLPSIVGLDPVAQHRQTTAAVAVNCTYRNVTNPAPPTVLGLLTGQDPDRGDWGGAVHIDLALDSLAAPPGRVDSEGAHDMGPTAEVSRTGIWLVGQTVDRHTHPVR